MPRPAATFRPSAAVIPSRLAVRSERPATPSGRTAFTLIELLVVISLLALLVSILLPSLARAKELGKKAVCQNNVRSLQIGNELYQAEHEGFYAPGASLIEPSPDAPSAGGLNLQRWFGRRESAGETPFDIPEGPLLPFLPGRKVRECPGFTEYFQGFETGCGGYGYNNAYVGRQVQPDGTLRSNRTGNRAEAFAQPSATVAFTDAALVKDRLIEYSFCEPPYSGTWELTPSIHFRHGESVCAAWLDSHVSEERMAFSRDNNPYVPENSPEDFRLGWFGPDSNELFDLD